MKSGGMTLCRQKAFALFRQDMDQYRSVNILRLFKHFDHRVHIVSVNRSEIDDPHILKVHAGNEVGLDPVLCTADLFHDPVTVNGNTRQCILHAGF